VRLQSYPDWIKQTKNFHKFGSSPKQATATHSMRARLEACISVSTCKSCAMSLKRKRFPTNAAKWCCTKYWPKLSKNQWPIILDAGLYTTCRDERVLVAIRFNATFQPLRPYCEKICRPTSCLNDAESLTVACCSAVTSFIFVFILWTLQSHFTLRLSARTLQCLLRTSTCHNTYVLYLVLTRVGLSVLLWM